MACSTKKEPVNVRLDGKTAIVTGGNTGIGKETARGLVERGAKVIITGRDEKKGREAADDIATADTFRSNAVVFKILKLDSLADIRRFAGEILESEPQINILINNAGGKINFDDLMMEKKYSSIQGYCQSKLANILFTKELAVRLQGTGVTTYAVHPGVVNTELLRDANSIIFNVSKHVFRRFFSTPAQGARTSIYCASDDSLKDQTGLYYYNCAVTEPSKMAKDMEVAHRLWDISVQLVGLEVQ